ncbi:hypothetical protein BH18ACT4_BH18ACT4_08130 [soil metagenome]
MSDSDADARNQEIKDQASEAPVDDDTAREALELELMDDDSSEEGEDVGEHIE